MTTTVLDSKVMATKDGDVDAAFRPGFLAAFGHVVEPIIKLWFQYELRGLENIPRTPCLFVGNHSGIGIVDGVAMMASGSKILRAGGRRVVGMMHDLFVSAPLIGNISRACGAVRAHPAALRAAFAKGHSVLVFPGGGVDSCRPFTAPREVRFGSHRGYVKLALELGVPIVPVATIGSHWTYMILPGGDAIARAIQLRRFSRDSTVPITFGALALVIAIVLATLGMISPWLIAAAALFAVVPNPVRVTTKMLAPIDVVAATSHLTCPEERIEAAHRLVHAALANEVATMTH